MIRLEVRILSGELNYFLFDPLFLKAFPRPKRPQFTLDLCILEIYHNYIVFEKRGFQISLIVFALLTFLIIYPSKSYAYEIFGIDSPDEASTVYAGSPKNIKNWPKAVVSAIETMQAEIILQAKDKKNWRVDRQVHGRVDELDEGENKQQNIFVSLGRLLLKPLTSAAEFLGFGKKQTLFTGDAWVYGPQDCGYPLDENSAVRISLDRFDILGPITDSKNPKKRIEYEFVVHFSISFWNCNGKPLERQEIPPTIIAWPRLEAADQAAIGRLFDGLLRRQVAADYNIGIDTEEEKLKELSRVRDLEEKLHKAISTQKSQNATSQEKTSMPTCNLTDPTGDHKNIVTGKVGQNPSADLKSARIVKQEKNLSVTIESAGTIPQFDKDSSLAYEIGFDRGGGSKNPLTPRNGADLLYIVDISDKVNGFKQGATGQENWQPQNVTRSANGISFTIPLNEVFNEKGIFPLRIYTSLAKNPNLEMDFMENEGMKKCL